jgi:tripartite-type tricarboxylate transporter receptor subunit TctC
MLSKYLHGLFGFFIVVCLITTGNSLAGFRQSSRGAYPNRPLTLIIPWAEKGGSDQVGRFLARLLEKELGQTVEVINKPSGSGVLGHIAGATAEPNGYILTMVTTEIASMHWMGLTEISYKNFQPVALVNSDAAGIMVRADSRWKTLEELQNEIKAKPGRLRASGTGKGGIWDIGRIGWLAALGLKESALPWMPQNGAAPALQQLMAGGVDVVTCSLPEAAVLIRQHKVRPLAVMGEFREPGFLKVPTLKEKRLNFVMGSFRGVAVPIQTPKSIIAVLEAALRRITSSQEFIRMMNRNNYGITYKNSQEFQAFLKEKDQFFGNFLHKLDLVKY